MNPQSSNSKALVAQGSILDVAKSSDVALALLDVQLVLLCDRSTSMLCNDAQGRRARFEVEDEIILKLQAKHPGKIALISFSEGAKLCLDGRLPVPYGNTNMVAPFDLAEPLMEAGARAVLISDGWPDDEYSTLERVKKLRRPIKLDCIYVGPEELEGQDFLNRLAKEAGGTSQIADLTKGNVLLEKSLTQFLLEAGQNGKWSTLK